MNENPANPPKDNDPHVAAVYDELRALAGAIFQNQHADHTLQPTALVHEAYLKLAAKTDFVDREHFLATAARAMRQVLINHANAAKAQKRGGDYSRITLTGASDSAAGLDGADAIDLADALAELEVLDERQCRIVECRFLAGMTVDETAAALDISPRTVQLDWRMARAWLQRRIDAGDGP